MKIKWRSEGMGLFLLLAMFIVAGFTWPSAPNSIPVHWGITGQPDRYGGKFEGLLAIPLAALVIYLLLLFLPRIDPRRVNYERFSGVYLLLRTVIVAFMAGMYVVQVMWVKGITVDMAMVVPLIIGLLLMVIGNYLGKLRSNWIVGIRTPWTLSSEESWVKTHRLGGRFFVAVGLALAVACPFQNAWVLYTIGILAVILLIFLVIYSYIVYRAERAAHAR